MLANVITPGTLTKYEIPQEPSLISLALEVLERPALP